MPVDQGFATVAVASGPLSIDVESRSIEAVLVTETPVRDVDPLTGQKFDEIVLVSGMTYMDQVPLLDSHRIHDLGGILGSTREIRREELPELGRVLVGRIYFDDDDAAEFAWGKYSKGHARDVSARYLREEGEIIPPGQSRMINGTRYQADHRRPLHVITKSTLREVSLTPMGSDIHAATRSLSTPSSGDPPTTTQNRGTIVPLTLQDYLENKGLSKGSTPEQTFAFRSGLAGRDAMVASILEHSADPQLGQDATRSALLGLGVDPEKPWQAAPAEPASSPTPDPAPDGISAGSTASRSVGPAILTAERIDLSSVQAAGEAAGVEAERSRVAAIQRLAGDDIPQSMATRAISEGWDETRASREFLGALREGRSPSAGPAIHSTSPEAGMSARSLAAGLLIGQSFDPTKHRMPAKPGSAPTKFTEQEADLGYAFRSLSAPDLVRACYRLDTGKHLHSIDELFAKRSSVSGGTLEHVFTANAYARLVEGWGEAADTTAGWCDEEDVANFLVQKDITAGADSALERLPEGGTARHASISDEAETYQIARYAKQFVVDERVIESDRLGAIMKMPMEMGRAAARLRPALVYGMINSNPALGSDGKKVYSASHGNVSTGAFGAATLKAMLTAMSSQRDGNEFLEIRASYLVVPASLAWEAKEILRSVDVRRSGGDATEGAAAVEYTTVNVLADAGLTLVVDDRLGAQGVIYPPTGKPAKGSDAAFYLFSSRGDRGIRVAHKRGTNRMPTIRSFELTQGQWGIGFDIKHDIGAAFMDHLGTSMSTGAGA